VTSIAVLSTYDEYGDIFQCSFEEWWANRGLAMYGSPYKKPIVKKIAGMSKGELYEPLFGRALEHYFNKQRARRRQSTSFAAGSSSWTA
jgi:hypothetical protein